MKSDKGRGNLHPHELWIYTGLGLLLAVALPAAFLLFPQSSFDFTWAGWALGLSAAITVLAAPFSTAIVANARLIAFIFTFLATCLLLSAALFNSLPLPFAFGYSLLLSVNLFLVPKTKWLLWLIPSHALLALLGTWAAGLTIGVAAPFLGMALLGLCLLGSVRYLLDRGSASAAIFDEALMDSAIDAILLTDEQGNLQGYNTAFASLFQSFPADTGAHATRTWMEALKSMTADPESLSTLLHQAYGAQASNVQAEVRLRDGRIFEFSSKALAYSNKSKGRIWWLRDITALRQGMHALDNVHERMRKQNTVLVKLALNDSLNSGNLDETMRLITEQVTAAIDADRVAVWSYAKETQNLVCEDIYYKDGGVHERGVVVSAGQSPDYFEEIATERVIEIPDAGHNPITINFQLPYGSDAVVRNTIDVPLRIAGELHGVLTAERDGQNRQWEVEDQQFLASVGDILATFFESIQRRRANERLANSVALLKSVFESTGVGILVTDIHQKIIDCNNTYLQIFQMARDFAMQNDPQVVMAYCRTQVWDQEELAESMRFLIENPGENKSEHLRFRDGRIVERYTEVLNVEGEVTGRVWFYRDVTDRERAQAAIVESEQRNKAIIEAIPDLMLRFAASGEVIDLKIPESGPLLRIIPLEESPDLLAMFGADFTGELLIHAKKAIELNEVIEYETALEIDDNVRDLEARLAPSGHDEVLLMLRDVTERIRTERELRQRNHELDSFVYRASHDLKAPLNSLMGLIEILKSESTEPHLTRYLTLMDKSVLKLDTFIRNLTEFSKIARLEIKHQPIDFRELLQEVVEGLHYMQNADRVKIDIQILPGVPFVGDSFHLAIVFGNLLSNAIKYQDLKKPDASVKVRVETNALECVIRVEDNGLGIAAEHRTRIFELFYRASNQSFGSGLGLYITRNAVEKMKGAIEMESEAGVGTSFVVRLPNHPLPMPQTHLERANSE